MCIKLASTVLMLWFFTEWPSNGVMMKTLLLMPRSSKTWMKRKLCDWPIDIIAWYSEPTKWWWKTWWVDHPYLPNTLQKAHPKKMVFFVSYAKVLQCIYSYHAQWNAFFPAETNITVGFQRIQFLTAQVMENA